MRTIAVGIDAEDARRLAERVGSHEWRTAPLGGGAICGARVVVSTNLPASAINAVATRLSGDSVLLLERGAPSFTLPEMQTTRATEAASRLAGDLRRMATALVDEPDPVAHAIEVVAGLGEKERALVAELVAKRYIAEHVITVGVQRHEDASRGTWWSTSVETPWITQTKPVYCEDGEEAARIALHDALAELDRDEEEP